MKNRSILAVFAVILTILIISSVSVSAQSNGGDDVVNTSSTSGTGTSEGSNSNGGDDVVSTPSNNTGGSTEGSNSNGGDDIYTSTPSTPSGPGTPDNGGGSSGGSSSGSRSKRTSGATLAVTSPVVIGVSTSSCPLITTYMKLGAENDPTEVAKLQLFLKNAENLDVAVSGIFDEKTDAAVRAFQSKYLIETMGPWDATRSSGFVYITTSKQINKLACATPLILSADELAIIEAYKARPQGEVEVTGADTNGAGTLDGGVASSSDIGSNDESNVAGAASASILGKFWEFIKNLFR